MDGNDLKLILGLALIVAITILLWRTTSLRMGGKAKLSFAKIFDMEIELGTTEIDKARQAVQEARLERGLPTIASSAEDLTQTKTTQLARILWVDDHPDNNLHETVALEQLGHFVTAATSTKAGLFYLKRLPFALAITDLSRGDNQKAGAELIVRANKIAPEVPIIVYTMNADLVREELVLLGASAVVDTPDDLLNAVLTVKA